MKKYSKLIILWGILFLFIIASIVGHFPTKISTAVIVLYGLVTQIFGLALPYLLSIAGAIPWVGSILAQILLWPLTALMSLLAVSIGLIKVKQGKIKDVIGARLATLLFAIGILVGYLIGKIMILLIK
ncbi:MAG: hypothetical protein ACMUJM_19620 [bacterium]